MTTFDYFYLKCAIDGIFLSRLSDAHVNLIKNKQIFNWDICKAPLIFRLSFLQLERLSLSFCCCCCWCFFFILSFSFHFSFILADSMCKTHEARDPLHNCEWWFSIKMRQILSSTRQHIFSLTLFLWWVFQG